MTSDSKPTRVVVASAVGLPGVVRGRSTYGCFLLYKWWCVPAGEGKPLEIGPRPPRSTPPDHGSVCCFSSAAGQAHGIGFSPEY